MEPAKNILYDTSFTHKLLAARFDPVAYSSHLMPCIKPKSTLQKELNDCPLDYLKAYNNLLRHLGVFIFYFDRLSGLKLNWKLLRVLLELQKS